MNGALLICILGAHISPAGSWLRNVTITHVSLFPTRRNLV